MDKIPQVPPCEKKYFYNTSYAINTPYWDMVAKVYNKKAKHFKENTIYSDWSEEMYALSGSR